jgi:hypothetical protein
MDNEFIDNNDDVRAPDNTKKEQLLQDNRSEYEKQMDEAMYLSIQEFKKLEEIENNNSAGSLTVIPLKGIL